MGQSRLKSLNQTRNRTPIVRGSKFAARASARPAQSIFLQFLDTMARDANEEPTCWKSCGRHSYVVFWVTAFLAVILSISITQPMQFRAWGVRRMGAAPRPKHGKRNSHRTFVLKQFFGFQFALFGSNLPVETRGICSVINSWTPTKYVINYDVKV